MMKTNLLKHIPQLVEFEEHVGKLWHRIISTSASHTYPEAAVHLDDVKQTVGIMFRALGGNAGLKIENSSDHSNNAHRSLLQKIAGSEKGMELVWRNDEALNLPLKIDVFPTKELNRDLYLWLAALASGDDGKGDDWFVYNQWLSCKVLKRFPGLNERYQRLLKAQLALRPELKSLAADEAEQEQAIQQALIKLESPIPFPSLVSKRSRPVMPVYLWLHPAPPVLAKASAPAKQDEDNTTSNDGESVNPEEQRKYQAEQVDMPDGKNGLVLDRFENVFSWAEYIKVDRSTEEEEDMAEAEDAAKDLDKLSVAQDSKSTAKRIRFDLDLPAEDSDDRYLGEGIKLPEWDYRKAELRKAYCCLQPMVADQAEAVELPARLRTTARNIRSQFEALVPSRKWYKAQEDGCEVDLDAYLDLVVEQNRGHAIAEQGLFKDYRGGTRDMACLLLADLSLSTDSWVNNHSRVIDVIRDSLWLFAEALSATGDQFGMYGFSSRHRDHIRFHTLKSFKEKHNDTSRGRIGAIKPGFYTRMGAAIRHATSILEQQPASQRLLLLLTDGKPNDLDQYEGRYGIEDTRMALIEARKKGLQPFCVTIDEKAGDYLPYMFGTDNFVVIRRPADLPKELPLLYARLTH
jgi:nitric oxide reductase NorD protein